MASEFDLIRKYFTHPTRHTPLGIGDDAALIAPTAGMALAVATDMLVAGTHFFADAEPYHVGWKSLAVNLSDMAAMGALPKWATLTIALPQADEAWVEGFAAGFFACADQYQVDLIGGDTTRGPLAISVQIMGEVRANQVLLRSSAKAGDEVWVSGKLGGAAIALAALQDRLELSPQELDACLPALNTPQPRVELALLLNMMVHGAIDISDGLLADLGHILKASDVGAEIHLQHVPCADAARNRLSDLRVQQMVLAGGDDYELCFTAPARNHAEIAKIATLIGVPLTRIGTITGKPGLIVRGLQNEVLDIGKAGFDHFA
ncbi:MAG TPA: thiamine-phosphate kinase [Methylophilaceae bacterium]|nr:thiamine-phosphate kinase [Methylophilaceae bacterium]